MPKAIVNARIYDFDEYIDHGYVVFDETILEKGPMEAFDRDDCTIIDGSGHLVIPSLVIGHTHIYSAFARGWENSFEYESFMDILEKQWWRLDASHEHDTIYHSGIVNAVDHVKNGVTTILDHHASGTIAGSLEKLRKAVVDTVGARGAFAFETSDRFDVEACLAENRAFIDERHPNAPGLFGLHASLSLSEETLRRVKERLGDTPIHIHVAESELDQQDCLKRYGERVVERLARHGLLNPGSILTHALHINDAERDLIAEHDCVVALNPSSNMNNAVGIPDYPALRKRDIPVIVGNDGLTSSVTTEYQALMFASHVQAKTPEAFDLGDLARILDETYAYASKLLGVRLGRLQAGYAADLLMLPYIPPTPMRASNALGHLFFGLFNSFKPSDVFIGGKHVVKDFEVDAPTREAYAAAKDAAQKLWNQIERQKGASR